jgi:acyl-CoA thioesterase
MTTRAKKIANDCMLKRDSFSQWLGIELMEIEQGRCVLQMKVRKDMLNGFDIGHGGISYSLADSALGFASNSYGRQAFSIETSISHTKMLREGDLLRAICTEISRTNRTGVYIVEVTNQHGEMTAWFKGTVYISEKEWEV